MKDLHSEDEDDDIPRHQNPSPNSPNSNPQMSNSTRIFPNFPHHPSFLLPPPHLILPRQHLPGIGIHQVPLSENTPVNSSTRPRTAPVSAPHRPHGSPREPNPEPDSVSPLVLEVPDGSDLITFITRFTLRRNIDLYVLSTNGAVENVTLNISNRGLVSCQGRFNIISLSACILASTWPFTVPVGGFTISLGGMNGQITVGKVAGPLVCAGTVYVVAMPLNNPTYARLPLEVECSNNGAAGGGQGGGQSSSTGSESHGEGDGSGCGSPEVFNEHQKGSDDN